MLDLIKISSDLLEILPESRFFCQDLEISPKSRFFFSRIWNFFARIWVSRRNLRFLLDSGFLPVDSGFSGFGGRETETDLLALVSWGEDQLPSAEVVGLASVGSVPVGFSKWIGSPDGFGQP